MAPFSHAGSILGVAAQGELAANSCFMACPKAPCPLRKTNMELEKGPFKEGSNLYKAPFQVPCLFSDSSCMVHYTQP